MKAISIANKSMTETEVEHNPEQNVFVDYRGFGKICLN